MKFFRKLATPFIAIGRWIKETAWVQPLLIVGVLFAIIFSIPSISKAIKDANAETDVEWYTAKQLKLDDVATKESQVNEFLEEYINAQEAWSKGNNDEAKNIMKKYSESEKFVLFFVQSDCQACEDTQEACEYVIDNWDALINNEEGKEYQPFEYQSIICDQEIEDKKEYEKRKPFDYLYGDGNWFQFIYDAIDAGTHSNYYRFGKEATTIQNNLNSIIQADSSSASFSSNFQTPMIVEFNLNSEENKTEYIISNIIFKLDGDDVYARSEFLVNMWKNKGVFSDNGKEF